MESGFNVMRCLLLFPFVQSSFNIMNYFNLAGFRSSHRRCSVKKVVLKNVCKFHRKKPVLFSLFNIVTGLKVFSCEICEIFKNTYFEEHLLTAYEAFNSVIVNPLSASVALIWKPVNWFAVQSIDWFLYDRNIGT